MSAADGRITPADDCRRSTNNDPAEKPEKTGNAPRSVSENRGVSGLK
jgi:hypothetical protein